MTPLPGQRSSIRRKMTLAALLPLVVVLSLAALAAFTFINASIVDEAQERVLRDLGAAREVLGHERDRVRDVVRFTAHGSALVRSVSDPGRPLPLEELRSILEREGLDLLTLTDARGRVLLRSASPGAREGESPPPPFVERALAGEDFAGPVLLEARDLAAEGEELAARARIPVRGAPAGAPGGIEERGLFLMAASAVHDEGGKVLGCLYGGVLLNGNLELVDRIRDLVYGTESFEETEVGSATIFLEGVRVATTIRLKGGERALGTAVSPEVAREVLGKRNTWRDRARVLDRWYLTAYEPILDPAGQAIGMLYVGLLEAPFDALKRQAALLLGGLLLLGGGLGTLLALLGARRLARPLLELRDAARKVTSGSWDAPLEEAGDDEVGDLTGAFNRMTLALRERDGALKSLNRELEAKVEERTAQLEEKSLALIRAQEELLRAERLAAIGSLAAGVAHEINNPAAIIRGNVEILLNRLPPEAPEREEAGEILKQTERVAQITRGMLAFAREQAATPSQVFLNPLLVEILAQIGHQAPLGEVRVETDLPSDLPPLFADRERLRQAFTNLLLNALQAMEGTGTLTVRTRLGEESLAVEIADTGPGIPREELSRIFNPFFTTKRVGTGLGLFVTYGIVKGMKGEIDVESEPGRGTLFRLRFPLT